MRGGEGEHAVCQVCWNEFPVPPGTSPPPMFCPDCEVSDGGASARAARLEQLLADEVWRDGPRLVTGKLEELPDACVRCNGEPDGGLIRRTLYWHPPVIYFLCCLGPLAYLIGALVARKGALLHIPVCARHRAERRNWLLAAWLTLAAGLGGLVVGAVVESGPLMLGGLVVTVLALVPSFVASRRPLYPVKIDMEFVWLLGAGEDYLDRLPKKPPAITGL